MAKKGKEGTTFKQRLNGNEYALRYAMQLYKKHDVKDILTAGIIAISWLSPEMREKVFDEATGAETGTYIRDIDIKKAISSDLSLKKTRKNWLAKYLERLLNRQQKLIIAQSREISNIEKSG